MKLAEALQENSSLRKKISCLREKLEKLSLAGNPGGESPGKLLSDLEESLNRMEVLVAAIQHTNALITVDGETMARLISKRDSLFFRLELYKNLVRKAEKTGIKDITGMKASDLQTRIESMLSELRDLDNLIQKTNWTRELVMK